MEWGKEAEEDYDDNNDDDDDNDHDDDNNDNNDGDDNDNDDNDDNDDDDDSNGIFENSSSKDFEELRWPKWFHYTSIKCTSYVNCVLCFCL